MGNERAYNYKNCEDLADELQFSFNDTSVQVECCTGAGTQSALRVTFNAGTEKYSSLINELEKKNVSLINEILYLSKGSPAHFSYFDIDYEDLLLDEKISIFEKYLANFNKSKLKKFDIEETMKIELDPREKSLLKIQNICEKLQDQYMKKIDSSVDLIKKKFYTEKKDAIDKIAILIVTERNNKKNASEIISAIADLYNKNHNIFEAEYDPISKDLVKALKVLLVGAGLLAGVIPGLIILGIFARISENKTGNPNFLSDEACKTSQAIDLKMTLTRYSASG